MKNKIKQYFTYLSFVNVCTILGILVSAIARGYNQRLVRVAMIMMIFTVVFMLIVTICDVFSGGNTK